jgi:UDP-N-acetylglucosamine 2-epimerase
LPFKQIVTVVGARPQFVKAAAVSGPLRARCRELLVHTGQHYDDEMSKVFFDELGLPRPDYDLGVGSGTHAEQTARMLERLEPVLAAARPDWVVVYGDTNSTLAGALAAAKLDLPVAHVEAGLRSYDRAMPEEINRVVADHLAALLLCPTPTGVENLRREGVTEGVHLVGDVMRDALERFLPAARPRFAAWRSRGLEPGGFGLVTVHRAGNTDRPEALAAIVEALEGLEEPAVFPVHPRTEAALKRDGAWARLGARPGLHVVPPLGYLEFLGLLAHARWVATDSGGVQKEAYLLGVPCLTLRDRTEWVETLAEGWNTLLGDDVRRLGAAARGVRRPDRRQDHYGDGRAGERVADLLARRGPE